MLVSNIHFIIYWFHFYVSLARRLIFMNIVVRNPTRAQKGHVTTDKKKCCKHNQLGVNYLKFFFLSYLFHVSLLPQYYSHYSLRFIYSFSLSVIDTPSYKNIST